MRTDFSIRLYIVLLFTIVFPICGIAQPYINLEHQPAITAGKFTNYFQESEKRLSIEQAIEHFNSRPLNLGNSQSISLGISVDPVWLKTRLYTEKQSDSLYRVSIETPWLDQIDAWLVHEGKVIKHITGGDGTPYQQRPMQYRYFAFESPIPTGETVLYLRVESVGPMAIPLRISKADLAVKRDISSSYQYGFLYGIMMALAMYNLIIFFSIKHKEYGLYALYLIGFVVNSLSYTGQLHTWITPDWGPYFQDWLDISLMITYSIAGLHFARALLNTKDYAPRLDSFTRWVTIIIPIGMGLGAVINSLTLALLLAFLLNTSFAILFIAMGYQALKNNVPAAKLFLLCSVTAAVCICISTAAVAGLLPYNDFTFKLIEVGMAFEAIFLAFLLAQRFRLAEVEKRVAEQSARLDSLTGLNNRRGFEHLAYPIWHQHVRAKRNVSVVLIDIDYFKAINDEHGHAIGDEVLRSVASLLEHGARKSDILSRWGGEEFLLMLPDTDETQAMQHAERLRQLIERSSVENDGKEPIQFTASFGVCGTASGQFGNRDIKSNDFEQMINAADKALYQVKNTGRNQVYTAS
ncbi:diguanylate cyclase [Alteromonas facilis]|uniref:diguanylate cyclase n=1 Tax=Alteromonas facilis TaxID=2048004 RepID=UPI000C28D622|nr:diguanylate cyclase [Alteromonas facilis]